MNMSGGEARKIDLEMVHNRIGQCLKLYMSQKEAASTLFIQDHVEPQITELVWQRLEEQNPKFFKAYYLKLMVKEQIMEFNRLLAEQVDLMRSTGFLGVAPLPVSNGSQVSPMQPVCCTGKNAARALNTDDIHMPIAANLPNAFTNNGSATNSCMQTALGMSSQNRISDVPSNMLAQSTNMSMSPAVNVGIIKKDVDYAANSSFGYAAPNNFLESHSEMVDASISSFSRVDSSLQSLNGLILDADASSFAFLGQLPHNFGLPDPTADISTSSDVLNYALGPGPFLATDTNIFLDPQGGIGRFE